MGATAIAACMQGAAAQAQNVVGSTVASSPSDIHYPYYVPTSAFGQNVDTDALEQSIRHIANNITLSQDEKKARIDQAVRDAQGGAGAACAQQLDPIISTLSLTGDGLSLAGGGAINVMTASRASRHRTRS